MHGSIRKSQCSAADRSCISKQRRHPIRPFKAGYCWAFPVIRGSPRHWWSKGWKRITAGCVCPIANPAMNIYFRLTAADQTRARRPPPLRAIQIRFPHTIHRTDLEMPNQIQSAREQHPTRVAGAACARLQLLLVFRFFETIYGRTHKRAVVTSDKNMS